MVYFHLNGMAVALYRYSKASNLCSTAVRSVKSLGESTLRWMIEK